MEAKIYNQKGKEAGVINLPEAVFGAKWNGDLVHQVVTSMETNRRKPYAHTKNRGDVRGGGKKPWQQKGTGRARHGSIRSPLWVGGGVTHGPRNEKNFDRKVNRKMKVRALYAILSKKWRDGEVLFVDSLKIAKPKTTEAMEAIKSLSSISGFNKLSTKKTNAAYIAIAQKSEALEKSFRNIGHVAIRRIEQINPVDLLKYTYTIISDPEQSLSFLSLKSAKTEVAEVKEVKVEKTELIRPKPKAVVAKKKKTVKKVSVA